MCLLKWDNNIIYHIIYAIMRYYILFSLKIIYKTRNLGLISTKYITITVFIIIQLSSFCNYIKVSCNNIIRILNYLFQIKLYTTIIFKK